MPFNKMVADENGNIFIGTDKYIRYITHNEQESASSLSLSRMKSMDQSNYRKFRRQEKLLYKLEGNDHLVSMWNQDGKVYFTTMPYALEGLVFGVKRR